MSGTGHIAGDIHAGDQARVHVGDNIEELIHFDVDLRGAQNSGSITIHVHDRSSGRLRLPNISGFFNALRASPAISSVLPFRPPKNSQVLVDALKKYEYRNEFAAFRGGIHPGTCQWIDSHPSLRWWSNYTSDRSILWITGAPGLGKTYLAAYLVESLSRRLTGAPTTVLYSFCNGQVNKTLSQVLCVALHQLLDQNRQIMAETNFEGTPLRSQTTSNNKSATKVWDTRADVLWRFFCDLVEESNLKRVYLIVDGLDDCVLGSQVEFFRLLRQMPSNLSVLVMSQPIELARIEASKWLANKPYYRYLELGNEETSINADIDSLIDSEIERVAELRGYSVQQRETAAMFLKSERSGIFLPVVLILAALDGSPAQELESVLDSTTVSLTGLKPLYEKLLSAIPNEMRERRSEILKNVLYTYRPLSVCELAFVCDYKSAMSHGDCCRGMDEEKEPSSHRDLRSDLKLLGPILRVRRGDDAVYFIHSSARKYLEEYAMTGDPSFGTFVGSSALAHIQLATLCIKCLISNSGEQYPSCVEDNYAGKLRALFQRHTLLGYAFSYWDYHARAAFMESADRNERPPHQTQKTDAERLSFMRAIDCLVFVLNSQKDCDQIERARFYVYFEEQKGRKYSVMFDEVSPLQLYLQLGLDSLVQEKLESYQNQLSGLGRLAPFSQAAVFWAVRSGNLETFQTILHSLEPHIDGPMYRDLLTVAASGGNPDLVRCIVSRRKTRHVEIARAALEAAAQPDYSVLRALSHDISAILAQDRNGMSVLHHLVLLATDTDAYRTDVIQRAILFFKECGVSLNEQDAFENTILHHICWSNSLCEKSLVKALLDHNANPHLRNKAGSLPLHLAARKANFEAFEFLLSQTKFDSLSGNARLRSLPGTLDETISRESGSASPDQVAVISTTSRNDIVRQMSQEQTESFRSRGGLTPLHWAMYRPCAAAFENDLEVLQLLLRWGFSLTAESSRTARSPLSIALDNPGISHILSLVYFRLDGANHMALSTANTIRVFSAATSVDDVWRGLDFERRFGFLLTTTKSTLSTDEERSCIQRVLFVYFVLGSAIIGTLIPKLLTGTEVIDKISQRTENNEVWDYTDPDIVKFRQLQILLKLQEADGATGKSEEVLSLERSVKRARRLHLARLLPANTIGARGLSGAVPTPRVNPLHVMAQKTMHKMDRFILVEEWQDFLWRVFGKFVSRDAMDLSASMASLALLPHRGKRAGVSYGTDKVDALTRLERLLVTSS
ncbi:uncharacterized protein PAC_16641 [Aspergillus udagawae]|uniref:Uncharacterized protein PAC_16641 n=1 Tax=Aspergillus udagawae TaxID=91492 RepID=A0ABQ1B426_9EURO|nr:uncharacterized protein PAC_16641 [Aspergillus udagawae]